MARGGARTGAGRPPGARNKRTTALKAAAAETLAQVAAAIPGAFEGDAHALLVTVYKDPQHDWPLRIDAAKAAIRFEKPALAATDIKADVNAQIGKIVNEIVDPRPHNSTREGF